MLDVAKWLAEQGLDQYAPAFEANAIDGDVLRHLSAEDLKELGVLPLGHRKRLLEAIAALSPASIPEGAPAPVASERQTPQERDRAHEAERRHLTILFCDLVGSTAISQQLDPEEMREVLRAYQNAVAGEITRYEGHVAKFMGDGVLAYFGWPRAHEDEAERAVRAGLAITQAVGRLTTPARESLSARVAIATGLVVVGDLVGEGTAREEAVVGETPNLAARLQGLAEAGAVVIADGTRRLLGELFELRQLAPTELKGFARPVIGYQVLAARDADSRFETRQSGPVSPMVGRDHELALALERWHQGAAGEGQAVLLVGEAGIGKSRLVQALIDTVAEEEHITLRYQCSPHHTGTALWPVARQLELAAGIAPADDETGRLDKIEALWRQGSEAVGESIPLIATLLGVDASVRYPVPELTPQQRRARTLVALVEQLLGLARRRPVLMVFEDAHWIDPTTLELLGQTLDRIARARVLLLITSRPDGQPTLGGHPHVTRLTLNRLGRAPIEAIVARLSGGRSLAPEVLGEIAARTDGVPLFIEELTKAVLEVGNLGAGTAVPVSLHDSLMARLDRVPEVKEVAQIAACIGREFGYPLLAAVSPLPESELQDALERLAAAELVFRRGSPPESSYTFKHALVRDAAHESLLLARRQQLHGRIVRTLEARFRETTEADPELLARHCTEAGLADKAVDYWQRAGLQALARSAMVEAVTQLTKALESLAGLPSGPQRQRRELVLQLALGRASIAARGFAAPDTGRAYARACELCRDLGEVSENLPALYGKSVFHFQRGEIAAAHDVAQELLSLAETQGDVTAQITGHRMSGSALSQLGKLVESRAQFEAALALYDPRRDGTSASIYAIDSRVMCVSWLTHVLFALGFPEQAKARSSELPGYLREIPHLNTEAVALSWSCIFHQLRRDIRSARRDAEAAIKLSLEQGFPLYLAAGRIVHGWALVNGGQAAEGITAMRKGLDDYRATGAEMWSPYFLCLLAEAYGRAGQPTTGSSLVLEALEVVEHTGARWIEAELHRIEGELRLADSEPRQAEARFRRALDVACEQQAKMWELRAATSLARLRCDQARHAEGRELLRSTYDWFSEGFDSEDLIEAKRLLDG